jgi:protein-arginine kinase
MASHGYLATCPTNLGTGMRASVHVNLPGFNTKQEVKDNAKTTGKYFLSFSIVFLYCECFVLDMTIDIRGTHGESKSTDGVTIYDVSNK